jgi:ATP-dependent DNA helicase RecG
MREAMRKANLSIPFFESDRPGNKFTLTLLTHHFFDEKDIQWLKNFKELDLTDDEARILIVVREMGAITNADFRNISCVDTLTASARLRRLRDLGLLEQKGRSHATYYTPTSKLLISNSSLPSELTALPSELTALPSELTALPSELGSLPLDLQEELKSIRKRSKPKKVEELIIRLCAHPRKLPELANLLNKHATYIRQNYLLPLIKSGKLEYIFPHQPNHPQQAYRTKN